MIFKKSHERGKKTLGEIGSEPRVVTCPQGVVIYRIGKNSSGEISRTSMIQHLLAPQYLDQKIRDMLAANPDIVFDESVQQALGISIVSFQRNKPPETPADEDIAF